MRILLVDDSAAYHEEFSLLLAESGVSYSALDVASTAAEGRRLMAGSVHDLYVIDYRLPGESGLVLVEEARSSGLSKPIIVLTAFDNRRVDAAAEQAGANDYLRKGEFTPDALGRAIRYSTRNAAAVEAARLAEGRFLMAQEAADIGVWEWDLRGNAFTWSPRQYENFGFDPASKGPIEYDTWHSAIHPADRDVVEAAITAAIAGRGPFSAKFRVMFGPASPSGDVPVHWISAQGQVFRDGVGSPTKMVGVTTDITEQQNALNAVRDSRNLALSSLQSSQSRFQAYFDNAPECLFYVRVAPDGRYLYEAINPAGLANLGKTLDEIRDRTPQEVLGPDVGAAVVRALRRVQVTGSPYVYEPTFTYPTGSITYDAIYMPLFDADGSLSGMLGSSRDVTERRRLEASLRQGQKMEALGQLASGVAHDFNNLLTGMLSCLELLGRHVAAGKGQDLITEGRRTVDRGIALTSRLLAFSRQQPLATQHVDFNSSIDEMTALLTRTLEGVRVGKELAPGLWPAVADRNQIEIALLNLAVNARDAMPLGGALVIRTANLAITTPQHDGLAPGDYVSLSLTDTGTGMTPDVLARAFDPFFTTKEAGKGTGLGLSMVYGMMQQLGGGMRISSEPGRGTTVTLLCPRAEAEGLPEAAPAAQVTPAAASILLVEDDLDTRAAVTGYAAELGLSVVTASSGSEAMALLRSGCAIDLLIADSTLPGQPGPALIVEARQFRPGLHALILSGQPDPTGDVGGTPVLAKPFGREVFKAAVEPALLGARPSNVVKLLGKLAG